jgi:hypothetical protein
MRRKKLGGTWLHPGGRAGFPLQDPQFLQHPPCLQEKPADAPPPATRDTDLDSPLPMDFAADIEKELEAGS